MFFLAEVLVKINRTLILPISQLEINFCLGNKFSDHLYVDSYLLAGHIGYLVGGKQLVSRDKWTWLHLLFNVSILTIDTTTTLSISYSVEMKQNEAWSSVQFCIFVIMINPPDTILSPPSPARVRISWLLVVAYLLISQMVYHPHPPNRPHKVGWSWSSLCMQCIPEISYEWPKRI